MRDYKKFKAKGLSTLTPQPDENSFVETRRQFDQLGVETPAQTTVYHVLALEAESEQLQAQIDGIQALKDDVDEMIKDAKHLNRGQ